MQCLIIDDNPKTAAVLAELLETMPAITQVHRAVQPYLVRSLMATEQIDIIFIRVRLWDFRQFERIEQVPVIVFLSGGKDKLTLKPGTAVKYSLREPYNAVELKQLLGQMGTEKYAEAPSFLFLRYDGRFHKTRFSDIEMIERKEGSYVQFHLKYGSWLMAGTIPGWLQKLPENKFIRVSDQLIVPIEEVKKITSDEYEYRGRTITLSFRFANSARREMENWPDGL